MEGQSGDSGIPSLRDHVDVFLCSKEGRAYLGQVPGVSMSLIRSDQELADVLNFMVFQFGGESLQPNTKPYTAAEVHALRQHPVKVDDIMTYRAEILGRALPACQHSKTP
ncbi:hypothetical protein D5366_10155 [Neokomagataea tanensis]|uniref:Uncharacterized protein n=1 Tax=Neokomagataea tanensis TaxID=661191 RepID=A0A4Y6V7H6_9PROT|nr:hypothetical protein D5366_10155 [Neokomagataea tanensis]